MLPFEELVLKGMISHRSSSFIFPYLFICLFIYTNTSYLGLLLDIQFEIKFIVP